MNILTLPPLTRREEAATAIELGRRHVDAIIDVVCRQFEVTREELLSRARPERIVWPRQIAMALAYELTGLNGVAVAHHFRRTHGNVCHAAKTVRGIESAPSLHATQIQRVRAALESERP